MMVWERLYQSGNFGRFLTGRGGLAAGGMRRVAAGGTGA